MELGFLWAEIPVRDGVIIVQDNSFVIAHSVVFGERFCFDLFSFLIPRDVTWISDYYGGCVHILHHVYNRIKVDVLRILEVERKSTNFAVCFPSVKFIGVIFGTTRYK